MRRMLAVEELEHRRMLAVQPFGNPAAAVSFASELEAEPPFTIVSTAPTDGAILAAAPTQFTVLADDDLDPLSVDASDLVIGDGSLVPTQATLQADNRTIVFDLPALPPGSYTVAIAAGDLVDDDAQGSEAFTSGFTVEPPFTIVSTAPTDGAILAAAPTQFTVLADDDLDPLSVDASDLVIGDGSLVPTQATLQADNRTIVFDLPALPPGSYTVAIAAGDLVDDDAQGSEAFTSGFEIDVTSPQVVTSSLSDGNVVIAGDLIYTVAFSEPLDESALDVNDVHLAGQLYGPHTPATFDYDTNTNTLTLAFANLPEDAYSLTLVSGASSIQNLPGFKPCNCPLCLGALSGSTAFQDQAGNPLAGGDFSVAFSVDAAGPTAVELTRLAPLGSFVYANRDLSGLINQPSDVDQYQLYVQAGQTVTAMVTPSDPLATLTVELAGHAGPIVAPGPGLPVLLPLSAVTGSGLSTLKIKGDRNTTYELDVVFNASLEAAVGNSSPGNSLDLTGSLVNVGLGRLAALGSSNPLHVSVGELTVEPNDAIAQAVFSGVGFGNLSYVGAGQIGDNADLAAAGLDVDLIAVQLAAGDEIVVDLDAFDVGSSLDAVLRLFGAGGQQVELSDDTIDSPDPRIEFTAPTAGVYYVGVSGFANLAYNPSVPASGIAGSTGAYELAITLNPQGSLSATEAAANEIDVPDVDSYLVDWIGLASSTIDIMLAGVDGSDFSEELLEIVAANGVTVLASAAAHIGVGQNALVITNFVAPADGQFSLRFTSATPGDYTLVVMQGAAFEVEPNDALSDPLRLLLPGQGAVGFLGPQTQATFGALTTDDDEVAPNLVTTTQSEPNNNLAQATSVPLGFDPGEDVAVDVTGSVSFADVDYYKFTLNRGDIFGANISGAAGLRLSLRDATGVELIGSSQEASYIYPAVSPLPGGGVASMGRVIDAQGVYYLRVSGNAANYDLNLRVFRPALESQPVGSRQRLFLDFDGAAISRTGFQGLNGVGIATLSPLSSFMSGWGLTALDEDAVIDAVVAVVQENLSADIRANGGNGDYASSGMNGEFDIEILNSRDHADPFGEPNVSRIIIGGTTLEFGLFTIGLAESIDVGNFDTEESAVVLLDLLSASPSDPNSLNQHELDPSASIIDLIGEGVGNIVSHEAAHIFGSFHTSRFSPVPLLTDQGGNLKIYIGLVGNVWGDGDEVDVDFGIDQYAPSEGYTGSQNSLSTIAYGLSTAINPALVGPSVIAISPPAGAQGSTSISQIVIEFSEALNPLTAVDPLNYQLIGAGANGLIEGGSGDDVVIQLAPSYDGDRTVALAIEAGVAPLTPGNFQLTISSSVEDAAGNALNSHNGPTHGSDYVHEFSVVVVGPGGDLYQVALAADQKVVITTQLPWDDAAASPLNDLRPQLSLFDPNGAPVAVDLGSLDGKNSRIEFIATISGHYTVQLLGVAGSGEYLLNVVVELAPNPEQLADFDDDDDTDGSDFLAWQRGLGMTSGAQKSDGNADGDNDVDGDDLLIWKALFGTNANSQIALDPSSSLVDARGSESPSEVDSSAFNAIDAAARWDATLHASVGGSLGVSSSLDYARQRRIQSTVDGGQLNQANSEISLLRRRASLDEAFASAGDYRVERLTIDLPSPNSVTEATLSDLFDDEIVDAVLNQRFWRSASL